MNYKTLELRRDGRVLYVDFDNPPLNLMTIEMVGELFDLGGGTTRLAMQIGPAAPRK